MAKENVAVRTIVYGRYPKYLDSFEVEKVLVHKCDDWRVHKPELWVDRDYLDVKKDAVKLKQIHRELKQNPGAIRLILPDRIIEWYRGSLTNLVTILHDLRKAILLTVSSEQIYEYMRDWKHEQALQTDHLLKTQGRTVGRPIKDVAITKILDMACNGSTVAQIATHFKVSRQLIWRRIQRVFEETDQYLLIRATEATKKLKANDKLKDIRVSMGERRKQNYISRKQESLH